MYPNSGARCVTVPGLSLTYKYNVYKGSLISPSSQFAFTNNSKRQYKIER